MRIAFSTTLWPIVLLATLSSLASVPAGQDVMWEATSGLLPDQSNPAWTLRDTASPEDPVLGPTFLTLSTSAFSETMGYSQLPPIITVSDPLVIEITLRVVSGSAASSVRAPVNIAFSTASTIGNTLFLGLDEMFLLSSNNTRGATVFIDTNDAFHTYRIEASTAGVVEVYYDDVLTLSGSTFPSSSANGTQPRVSWGLGSTLAQGTAEWMSLSHNAGPQTVPAMDLTTITLLGSGLLALALFAAARRRWSRVWC